MYILTYTHIPVVTTSSQMKNQLDNEVKVKAEPKHIVLECTVAVSNMTLAVLINKITSVLIYLHERKISEMFYSTHTFENNTLSFVSRLCT